MADSDIRTLTSFDFELTEPEEAEEKLLSKLFTKFKTAMSGSQDPLNDVSTPALKSQASSSSIDGYTGEPAGSSSLLQGAKRQIYVTSPTPPASCKDSVVVNFPSSSSIHSTTTITNSSSSASIAAVAAAVNQEAEEHAPVTRHSQDNQPPPAADDSLPLSVPIYRPPSADSDTQSVATTFSISTSHSLSRIIARLRGQKSDKEFWMPDEQCKECYKCHKPFNVLRRRHHCRICGQIFCGKCASHTISGKLYKQKGEVRVCNFCYREHLMGHTADAMSSTSVVRQPEEDVSNDNQYQAVIPSQPPPIAAPKMQIPTAAVKQSQSQYGHSTTVAVELLASDSSRYLGSSAEKTTGNSSRSGSISAGNGNEIEASNSPAAEGSFSKRLLDAGSSFLKSRPRSTTLSSMTADDIRFTNSPTAPLRGNSATNSLTTGRGGGTLVTEGVLSPFIGRDDDEEEIKNDMLQEFWSRSSSSIPGGGSSLRIPSSGSNNSQGVLAANGRRQSAGSDDEAYDFRLRDKRTEELRGQSNPERSVSFRRQSIGGSKKGRAAFRQKGMHISTTNLPKSEFLQSEGWSPSPFLSPLEDRYALNPLDHAIKNRLLTPRHRRISAPPPNVELSYGAVMHARKMLKQLMADESFSALSAQEKTQWEDIIMKLLLKVTDNVRPDVRSGDDMDIRHYVKIKKIPGGLPTDSFYVKGVMCSKNVAHKAMVRNISQPRILILLFSLDYSRVEMENQLMSIEPMIAQEREHIKKLVARIAALRPSLLLVKSTVSRLALEFLLEKNIPVIHNVKYSVIQAVARCTRASIVQSVENLHSAGLSFGQCGTFEIRTIIHDWLPNRRKTFLIFDDCQPDLGGTIVLRGAQSETLQLLKRLIDFMVFVVHNLKLETSLLRDSFAKNRGLESDVERERSPLVPESAESTSQDSETKAQDSSLDGFSKLYEDTILSASQFVVFPQPYVLTQLIETNNKITAMNAARKSGTVPSSPTKPVIDISQREPVMDAEYEHLVAKRNHLLRAWQAYLKESVDYINPFYHQNIVVLYSNVCTVTTVPCQGPEVRMFEYYCQPSDMTLGDYLVELCEDALQLCPSPMCEHQVLDHYRSYAHGSARINVMIEKFPCPQPGMSDKLLMWSYCRQCEKPTPVIPMSENTYSYSFGKFLEICLYQKGVYCRADICPHDIGEHHVRYFGYKDFAVRFLYDPIDLLEVAVPPMKLFILSQVQINQKEEDAKNLRTKTNKFYQSIVERNKAFPFYLVNPSRLEQCKTELQEMSQRCDSEKKQVLQYIQNVYATTKSTDTLTINWTVRTILYQHIERWDEEYANLVREYLQPELELRKITANLRKVFPQELPEVTGGERTKRATEVTDLPLLGNELEDEVRYDQELLVPRMLPQLLPSPNNDSKQEEDWKSEQEGRSLLRPEVKRRLSLELLRELRSKLRNEDQPEKSRSAVLSTSAAAATTPSRIPVFLPGSHHIRTKVSPPWNESILQNVVNRPFMIDDSDHISRQRNIPPHYRYSSVLLGSSSNADRLQPSPLGATRHSSLHVPSRGESESKRLRKALTARDRHFRSRLPRKKTSMQVYTRVNDLVKENMEDEVGDLDDEREAPIDYFSPLAPYAERVNANTRPPSFFSQRYDGVAEAITGFGTEIERLPPLAVDLLDPPHVSMVAGISSSDVRPAPEGEEAEEGQGPSGRRTTLQDVKAQPEKSSFMKTITSFLTDSGVANLLPLEYPLQRSEYIFPDSPVIVREDEPSTIIAYTLSCQDYLTHMNGASDSASELSFDDNPSVDLHETASETATMASPGDIKDILLKESGIHIGFNFRSDSTRFFCKIFFVDQFDALRRNCGCDESYIYSLASCLKWDSSGGKSGSAFLKTKDDRLLMKQLSRFELDAFLKFAPAYFHYMSDAFFREMPTVLAKIFGFYSIGFKNSATGKSMHMDVLVMENLFYQRNVKKIFDLKGSMRNRHVQSTGKQDEVLLDENLVELIYQSPLFIRTHSKEILRSSLHNDTLFLGNSNVMDYSLLVGIDEERQELVVGIVDFIRTFTWDKKLESWVKESGILGGGGKEPTIVSPRQYRIRFREAMERYFLMVPDEWSVFRQIRAPFAGLYHHHQQQHADSD